MITNEDLGRELERVDYMQLGKLAQLRVRCHSSDRLVTVEVIRNIEDSLVKWMFFGKLDDFFNTEKTVDISHGFHYVHDPFQNETHFYEFECDYYRKPFKQRLFSRECNQSWDYMPALKQLLEIGVFENGWCYRTDGEFKWEGIRLVEKAVTYQAGNDNPKLEALKASISSTRGHFWTIKANLPIKETHVLEGSWVPLSV